MKTGLTLEGINILEDPSNKLGKVIEEINNDRSKIAKDHIQEKIEKSNKSTDSDDIEFLQFAIQILKEDYNLDSAGIYEYLKEIIDTKIGAKFRKKVWKEVENGPGIGTRYTRCLIVTVNDISYIIDVTKDNPSEIFQEFDEKELEEQNSKVIPFKEMARDWRDDPYDGR